MTRAMDNTVYIDELAKAGNAAEIEAAVQQRVRAEPFELRTTIYRFEHAMAAARGRQ